MLLESPFYREILEEGERRGREGRQEDRAPGPGCAAGSTHCQPPWRVQTMREPGPGVALLLWASVDWAQAQGNVPTAWQASASTCKPIASDEWGPTRSIA